LGRVLGHDHLEAFRGKDGLAQRADVRVIVGDQDTVHNSYLGNDGARE
jgi:hypothetical protein